MIRVSGLRKRFVTGRGAVAALDDVSFEVPAGQLLTLLGPSGCGKTTALRCVAGLERPEAGEIEIAGRVVSSAQRGIFAQPNERNSGIVFQSYAVWPHMTVYGNVAYPLKPLHLGKDAERERVVKVLELVGLSREIDRPSPFLSGGQQQRVALARAIVGEPDVLLLDEPLSNLDAKLREEMRAEIRSLQQRLRITAIYVTHDQVEALAISDVVALMSEGRIVELGPPREIYDSPRSRFAAEFTGAANLIALRGVTPDGRGSSADVPWGRLRVAIQLEATAEHVVVRPDDIELVTVDGVNTWPATVADVAFLGAQCRLRLLLAGGELVAHVGRRTGVRAGDAVRVHIADDRCVPVT